METFAIQQPQSVIQIRRNQPSVGDCWSTVVHRLDQANLGHSPEWYSAIHKAYGHTPIYLEGETLEGEVGILPAFLIRRSLFGTVVTSMPFLDNGGPCTSSQSLSRELVVCLIKEAARRKASLVELRCTSELDLPISAHTEKVNLSLPLPKDPVQLWKQLDAKVRNQVRKAERSGLSVEFGHSENLPEFYETFAVNMRDLGSPVHSRAFFHAIFDAFGDKARVAFVRKGSEPIGGLVALAFKDSLVVPWASSLRDYFSLCPNMLLYWETIRSACLEGFQRFEFGRSTRDSGTYRFKRQWGATEEPLYWYSVPVGGRSPRPLSSSDARGLILARLWQRLPLRVANWFGPIIRKYLTL
jgi:serine/alanine adding enzyme